MGLTRCDVATGTCQPLTPMTPPSCTETADCEGGRVCVDGSCHFAPSCQRVLDGGAFDYVVRCASARVEVGSTSATTNGCNISLPLPLSEDGGTLTLSAIPATEGELVEIGTSPASTIPCATGTWSAAHSGLSLTSCTLPGGEVCDVGFLRAGAGPVCLADGTGCASGKTCEPIGNDPNDVGRCR